MSRSTKIRIIASLSLVIALVFASSCCAESYGKNLYRSMSKRLGRTRADYPALSDSDFANFRMVTTTGIAPGKLFRSASPIHAWGERNEIADSLARSADIKTFINLSDSYKAMREHKGYPGSYYSTQKVTCLNLGMKYTSAKFLKSLARGIHFMAVNDPPYLIHCSLGKDRSGFVCALIECLAGATWPEVERDYMISFRNYFGMMPGTKEYDFILNNELAAFLARDFGVKNLAAADLSSLAQKYFENIGVSSSDIQAIRQKLAH